MPRTCRSQAKVVVNVHANENMDVDTQPATNHLQAGRKRTLEQADSSTTPTPTAAPATSEPRKSKRARTVGPARGRPLQLDMGEGDVEGQQGLIEVNNNTRRPPPLTRTASVYPGRELFTDATDVVLSHLPSPAHHENDFNDGDTEVESVDDWCAVPQPAEPTGRATSKAMLVERPIWHVSPPSIGSATAENGRVGDDTATPQGSGASDAPNERVVIPESSQESWPTDTELILVPGSNKILLTLQRPVMRAVFHDTFERIRAAMMFQNAFPNVYDTIEFITDNIIRAAESVDQATNIFNRLVLDGEYTTRMTRLPRARIPIFRREVKEHCATLIQAEFMAFRSHLSVVQLVEKQLSNYNYTFPKMSSDNPANFLPRRTRPYRNIRIINVIRDLFFVGGNRSFSHRSRSQFPIHQDRDGMVSHEVPMPMVALVATALYAAIQEWRTGVHKSVDFSTNAFLDVYSGHINTFNHIRSKREEAFHVMMSDIYTQASSAVTGPSATPIADIELDDIEG